jgi:tetratricopeptide (TPR) repeat protein
MYLDALDYYRAALAQAPTAVLHLKCGMTELEMARYKDARKSFERALKLDSRNAEAYNNLGVVYYLQKKYGGAEKDYRKAIELNGNSASFYSNLGQAYFSDKKFSRAAVEFSRAVQLDPEVFERASRNGITAQLSSPADRAHYSYLLAEIYARSGDAEQSLHYLRRAIEDGYANIKDAYKDEAFANLRKDPRFGQLMSAKLSQIPQDEAGPQ